LAGNSGEIICADEDIFCVAELNKSPPAKSILHFL
jgi:hypothetical protein